MWNDKKDKIKRTYLYNDYKMGGIKLINIKALNLSLKASVRIWGIHSHVLMALNVYVCYQALTVFVVFCLDGRVFMWSGVMHIPNVVSSLFGCFRV